MTYNDEEILRRLRIGEDSAWEFKQLEFSGDRPISPRRDDWANEIAAFANASGGVLLCGVSDDGEVQDMSREQIVRLDAHLVEICTDTIKPPVRIKTHHTEVADGKLVLLVEVPAGDSVHEAPGGSYIRVGASKRRMTSDERLRQARFRWFDEQPVHFVLGEAQRLTENEGREALVRIVDIVGRSALVEYRPVEGTVGLI